MEKKFRTPRPSPPRPLDNLLSVRKGFVAPWGKSEEGGKAREWRVWRAQRENAAEKNKKEQEKKKKNEYRIPEPLTQEEADKMGKKENITPEPYTQEESTGKIPETEKAYRTHVLVCEWNFII